jgi:hypothetical protein
MAKTLAAAGGHQHHGVAAGRHRLDDVLLFAAEGAVAEYFLQDGVQILRVGAAALGGIGGDADDLVGDRPGRARGRQGIEVVVVVEIRHGKGRCGLAHRAMNERARGAGEEGPHGTGRT